MKKGFPFEIKRVDGNSIEGHGSVFGNVDLGGDIMIPGAFKRSLATHKANGTTPAMLWQHDTHQPIGVWHEFAEDDTGLALKGEFADTPDGRNARILAQMRAVGGLSVGFMLKEFDFDKEGNRLIKEVDLWETSVVTFPMNTLAAIEAVKSEYPTPRAMEHHLRDVGCSIKSAKVLVSSLYGSGGMSDSDQRDVDGTVAEQIAMLNDAVMAQRLKKLRKGYA